MWSKNPNISAVKFKHFPIFLYRPENWHDYPAILSICMIFYGHWVVYLKPTFSLTDNSDNKGDSWGYDPWP